VSKLARRIARRGELYTVDINGDRHAPGTRDLVKGFRVKSKDGWWARRQAELVEKNLPSTPPKHPLDRRIERAIKKATER
jgi:hypothetical protein